MKQTFACSQCGRDVEIEADYFVPGVTGRIVGSDGVVHTFVDPTDEHLCDICLYIELRRSFYNIVGEEKAKEILHEHDQRLLTLLNEVEANAL